MDISKEIVSEEELKLIINGKINTDTYQILHDAIAEIDNRVKNLVLDFNSVEYISSAGLREIVICVKRMSNQNGKLSIVGANQPVYETFSMTGLTSIVEVSQQEEAELDYLKMSFKGFLENKSRMYGDRTIIVSHQDSYTWKDIETAAQIMAIDLAKQGIARNTHVILCGANSINWVVAFFAIQKLGAIAMLINCELSAQEIGKIVKASEATHFCYGELSKMNDEESFLNEIKSIGTSLQKFYSIRNDIDLRKRFDEYEELKNIEKKSVEPDDPCVVLFTSGSTGKPKGVLLSAYNILNSAGVMAKEQHLVSKDKMCLILPLYHIFGLCAGLFSNSLANSTIYIPKDIRTATLLNLIEKEQCTIFHTVPTMLIALINNKDFRPERLSTLRCTILAGSSATEAQIKMFREKIPNDHFMSAYGLSEMAPVTMTQYEDTDEHILQTVGKPIEFIDIEIKDAETKEACEPGKVGEVMVQGSNLMIGYYKTDIDAQPIDMYGWLHTGDLGYIADDGYLHLTGRMKDLIIRGGENIMPAEVEAAISELPIVDNVKVIGIPSDFFGEEVGACIKLKSGAEFDKELMNAELSKRIAKYKIPGYYFIFDEFPMLGSGKIDSVALKKDVLSRINKK